MTHQLREQFYQLTPDAVLCGVEQSGYVTTGEYIQLNSYENRVFDIFLEPELNPPELNGRVIAKYYRPLRWSHEAILEEHFFLHELFTADIPVITPLEQKTKLSPAATSTLSTYQGLYLALFKKGLGRTPQELSFEQLRKVGRLLAQIHNIGEQKTARYRPTLHPKSFGWPTLELLKKWVAPEVWGRYQQAATQILEYLEDHMDINSFIRIHGDCHKGNLLIKDQRDEPESFFFVDFDDFCNGPAAQDFWMLFSSDEQFNQEEQQAILAGYEDLRRFPADQLKLFAPLRGLRILHYAGWIARRWHDPTFPQLFPQFTSYTYWAEETEALEKIAWSL